MALTHRKLYTDPFYEATIQICKPYCNFITNPRGICPFNCFSICISSCKISIPPDVILFSAPPPPPPPESPHHHLGISARFLISIVILVTLFLCFILYKSYKAYRYRSRRLRTESQPQTEDTHQDFLDEDHGFVLDHPIWYIRTIGLQPSVISAITICKYKKGEGLVEGTECSVCLSEFQEDETLRLLPKCNHAFHIPCIDTWLRSHTNCPLCRAGIVSNVAVLPAPGQRIDDSNVLEEDENRMESERAESEGEPRGESERKGDEIELGNLDQLEVNEVVVQPIRRSVSVDLSSAIPGEMVSVVDVNLGKLVGSCSSSAKSLEKEPDSMKRSISCNGKVLFSKHNNSQRRS